MSSAKFILLAACVVVAFSGCICPVAAQAACEQHGEAIFPGLNSSCLCDAGYIGVNCSQQPQPLQAGTALPLELGGGQAQYINFTMPSFSYGRTVTTLTVSQTAGSCGNVTAVVGASCPGDAWATFFIPEPPPLLLTPPAYQLTSIDGSDIVFSWGEATGEFKLPGRLASCEGELAVVVLVYSSNMGASCNASALLTSTTDSAGVCSGSGSATSSDVRFYEDRPMCDCTGGKVGEYCDDDAITVPADGTPVTASFTVGGRGKYLRWTTATPTGRQFLELSVNEEQSTSCSLEDMRALLAVGFTCADSSCLPKLPVLQQVQESQSSAYAEASPVVGPSFLRPELLVLLPLNEDNSNLVLGEDLAAFDSYGCGCSQETVDELTWYAIFGAGVSQLQRDVASYAGTTCAIDFSVTTLPALCNGRGSANEADVTSSSFACQCVGDFTGRYCNGSSSSAAAAAPPAALGPGAISLIVVSIIFVFFLAFYCYTVRDLQARRPPGSGTAVEMSERSAADAHDDDDEGVWKKNPVADA